MTGRTFRFAPSPNGALHLGHAYSALLNHRLADLAGARFLLRMEDIDVERCTPEYEQGIYCDLQWLGLDWERPVRRQSEHFDDYAEALERLADDGFVYPAFMSRAEFRSRVAAAEERGARWPRDPDGVPHYPGDDRRLSPRERRNRIAAGEPHNWRLDVGRAAKAAGPLSWAEHGAGPDGQTGMVAADPAVWGDAVLARRDAPASYHLCVVVDDAIQGVTDVVRGRDLFFSTAVHRLIQALLGLPAPDYLHHDLVLDEDGRKLSKSRGDTALSALRAAGMTAADIARMVGLPTKA